MKPQIIQTIRAFINSRPGLDPRDYDRDPTLYRADSRMIQKQRRDALAMLAAVEARDSITADQMLALQSHRFTIKADQGRVIADYTTGQFYPTEYRAGAARYLASLIWAYIREHCNGKTTDDIRKQARLMLGASIARKYFN